MTASTTPSEFPVCLAIQPPTAGSEDTQWGITTATLPSDIAQAIPKDTSATARLTINGISCSLFYSPSQGSISFIEESDSQPLSKLLSNSAVDQALTTMDVFYLGGQAYLATYDTASSYLNLYRISADYSLSSVRNQYVGEGFTMMHVLPYRDTTCVVLYNGSTGACVKYQISVPPYDGLSLQEVWSDVWAKTWGHFTFFAFGGENFFLKINQQHEKVNIDHFMDDPDEGSHPVLSENASQSMLNAASLVGFQGKQGQSYFFVYENNGSLSLNSIYPNCLGWWPLTHTQTIADAGCLHAIPSKNSNWLLLLK